MNFLGGEKTAPTQASLIGHLCEHNVKKGPLLSASSVPNPAAIRNERATKQSDPILFPKSCSCSNPFSIQRERS
jgi:hypothetical protein